jgi:hypothetical protein
VSSGPSSTLAAVPVHFRSGLADVRTIVRPGSGATSIGYQFSSDEFAQLESLSADVDTTAAGASVQVEATLADQAGVVVARSRTGAALDTGLQGQATFAPGLSDTSTFPATASTQQIQTALWEGTLPEQAIVTVEALDAGAIVTELRILTWELGEPSGHVPRVPATGLALVA